jgi:hypothetical protein
MTLVRRCAHGHKRYSPDDNVVLGELAPPVMVCRALWRLMSDFPDPGGVGSIRVAVRGLMWWRIG